MKKFDGIYLSLLIVDPNFVTFKDVAKTTTTQKSRCLEHAKVRRDFIAAVLVREMDSELELSLEQFHIF